MLLDELTLLLKCGCTEHVEAIAVQTLMRLRQWIELCSAVVMAKAVD